MELEPGMMTATDEFCGKELQSVAIVEVQKALEEWRMTVLVDFQCKQIALYGVRSTE
jgi:hypothetical protein